ncbi:hypothetical protein HZH68_015814 [Vespula germanica]|uniref:Uncharacterized protein n=1 Tax=Vespula germanica TaxID=30212 RepID=A0A834J6D1_VESGE|nr:hypothetical protein HZH68_015814 [Vespula germanica]
MLENVDESGFGFIFQREKMLLSTTRETRRRPHFPRPMLTEKKLEEKIESKSRSRIESAKRVGEKYPVKFDRDSSQDLSGERTRTIYIEGPPDPNAFEGARVKDVLVFLTPIKRIIRVSFVPTHTDEIVFHEGEGIVPRRVRETRRFSTIQNNGKRLSDVSQRQFGALLHPRDSKTERKGRAAKHEKRLSWASPLDGSRRKEEEEEEEEEEKEEKEKKEKFAANGVPLMNAFFVPGKQRGPGAISSGGRKALQACQELSKQRGIDTVTQWLPALLTNESAQGRRGTARNWPGAKVGRPSFERGIDSNLATSTKEGGPDGRPTRTAKQGANHAQRQTVPADHR